MVNAKELKAEFVRNGFTQKEVALKLNISERTLSSKLKKGVFGSDEIETLMKLLKINNPVPIFFS